MTTPAGRAKLAKTRERLLSRISPIESGCWQWKGFITPQGYGATSYRGRRSTLAHRAVYTELRGQIDEGMTLDHLCHTADMGCPGGISCEHRRCVNPNHLEQVTAEVNNSRGAHARKTHCPHGHEYSPENTKIYRGSRFCITCQRIKDQARRGRQ